MNGLCSGAYHAFHGALADERVGALLPINLPLFTLRYEKPGPSSFARQCHGDLVASRGKHVAAFCRGDAGLNVLEKHFGTEGIELTTAGRRRSIVAGPRS